jgi:chorismate mutase
MISDALKVRGIRGAITAAANTSAAILTATDRLLREIVGANQIQPADLAAVLFTATQDLTAEFPAAACRALGWNAVPLLCATEMNVATNPRYCIRVLLLVNSALDQSEIKHVYLEGAARLRPDLSEGFGR